MEIPRKRLGNGVQSSLIRICSWTLMVDKAGKECCAQALEGPPNHALGLMLN